MSSDQPRPSAASNGGPEQGASLSGWQPIETAPMRGPVLTFLPDPRSPAGGWVNVQTWRGREDGWCGAGESKRRRAVQPTHWMPLPRGPQQPTGAI